jgi:hypothetical protein
MEELGEESGIAMNIEIQTLWNFRLEVSPVGPNGAQISSTGYHTHGMKKGKQIDERYCKNLIAMGMTPPSDDQKNWKIDLQTQECKPSHINRIVIHILERGYEFNPNLIQQVFFEQVS